MAASSDCRYSVLGNTYVNIASIAAVWTVFTFVLAPRFTKLPFTSVFYVFPTLPTRSVHSASRSAMLLALGSGSISLICSNRDQNSNTNLLIAPYV